MQKSTNKTNTNQGLIKGDNNLSKLPLILHNSIRNWEIKMTNETGTHWLGYEELSAILGKHPQTIRKWTNQFDPKFPPVNQLALCCKVMDDWSSWDYVVNSTKGLR